MKIQDFRRAKHIFFIFLRNEDAKSKKEKQYSNQPEELGD